MNWKQVAGDGMMLLMAAIALSSCGSDVSPATTQKKPDAASTTHLTSSGSTPPSYPATYPSIPGSLRSTTSGDPLIAVTDCEVSSRTEMIDGSTYLIAIASGVFLGAAGGSWEPGQTLTVSVFDQAGNNITVQQVPTATTQLSKQYLHGNPWQAEALLSTGFEPVRCNVDLSNNG